jgi:TonB-dependent receptor
VRYSCSRIAGRTVVAALLAGACLLAFAGSASAQTRRFDLPEGRLGPALDGYIRQSGVQLIYRADELGDVRTAGVHGLLDPPDALARLLAGTGFGVRKDASGAVAIVRIAPAARSGDSTAEAGTERPSEPRGSAGAPPSAPPQVHAVREVVVTGERPALRRAQERKRNADTILDSITANDIGAFPDKSVAEALQRVPGVTVNRFAASDDTSHFSAEPSGVLVRGLPQVRNAFNGRDTFSADSSRGLGWGDISPELLAGVDVYKAQTADMIEGGIAASIDLRTRLPFDAPGALVALTADANYGDLSRQFTPDVSGMVSRRWTTPLGEFGALANFANSDVQTQSQGIQYGRMGVFQDIYSAGFNYIPSSVAERDVNYDRTRQGMSLAGQWRDPDRKFLATAQFNQSIYQDVWKEYGLISYPIANIYGRDVREPYSPGHGDEGAPLPAPGTSFSFYPNGDFRSGVLTVLQCCTAAGGGNSWWGADQADASQIAVNSSGQAMLEPCYTWQTTCAFPDRAPDFEAVNRYYKVRTDTEDVSLNLKWTPNDRWRFSVDLQDVHSTVRNYDVEVGQYSFADLGLNATGERPSIAFLAPTNINPSPGGLSNPDNYRYNHVMDHMEDSVGDELAARADGEVRFHEDWLDSLKFGARYSDRRQEVRYSAYNWGNISNDWNLTNGQSAYWNIDRRSPSGAFTGYPQGLYQVMPFGGGYFGSPRQDYVFFNENALAGHAADLLAYSNIGAGQDQWEPLCRRAGDTDGCFRPDELNRVSETTAAAYLMLKFGGRDARVGPFRVSGNFGVRYVYTRDRSTGATQITPYTPAELACAPSPPPQPGQPPPVPQSVGCYLTSSQIAFAASGTHPTTVATPHHDFLPSFNLKLDIGRSWDVRFAISESMSRPDIGLLKNYVVMTPKLPDPANPNDPLWIKDSSGVVTGAKTQWIANAYNPYLAPPTASGVDIALENYFSDTGYFALDVFQKNFDDYIQYETSVQNITVDGVTTPVQLTGPGNGRSASLQGVEFAFQRFADFLPSPWNGLGLQANFTYIQNHGIRDANLKVASGGTSGATVQPGSNNTSLNVSSLEQLSKTSFNLVGMYEKGPLAIRLAYNWRSRYLVTAVDCCIYLPVWADGEGFLDGSIRYRLTPHLELSLQGSNLLSTDTVLRQQVNDSGKLEPGSWFQNDRRVVAGVRLKY